MYPLIAIASYFTGAFVTKQIIDRVRPSYRTRHLSECSDVGYVDPKTGKFHSLMPTAPGYFAEDGRYVYTYETEDIV